MAALPNNTPEPSNFFIKSIVALAVVIAFGYGYENLCHLGLNTMQIKAFAYSGVLICFACGIIVTDKE
jgi:hypothetical protein